MKKIVEISEKTAAFGLTGAALLGWVSSLAMSVYLYLWTSALRGSYTLTYWTANSVILAGSILLPLVVFWLFYSKIKGKGHIKAVYASFAMLAVTASWLVFQSLGSILPNWLYEGAFRVFGDWGAMFVQQIVPLLILIGLLVWAVSKFNELKTLAAQKTLLRKALAAAVAGYIAVELLTIMVRILSQYPSNPNLSGFVTYAMGIFAVLVALAAVFIMAKRHKTKQPVLVALTTVAFAAVFIQVIFQAVMIFLGAVLSTVQTPVLMAMFLVLQLVFAAAILYWAYRSVKRVA